MSPSSSRLRRALPAAAALLLIAIGPLGPRPAGADTVNTSIAASCTSPIGPQAVSIPATVTDTPDTVDAGDDVVVTYRTDYPSNVVDSMSIDEVRVTWPMPPEISTIVDVDITNLGTFTADPPVIDELAGTVSAVFHDGGQNRPPTPIIAVTATVDPGATGTIDWPVFVTQGSIASNVPFVGTVDSTCTPTDAGQVVNTTTITGGGPTPGTCTQVASADGWTKTLAHVGPGGATRWDGTGTKMYTTDDGLNRYRSAFRFPGVGGACAEGGTLPAGATVTGAAVLLTKTKSCICVGPRQRLHRITQSWGESDMKPTGGPTVNATYSAELVTPALNAQVSVSSPALTADVQAMVTNPSTNWGWSLRQRYNGSGDTGNNADPAGWATRESGTPGARPTLVITYTS
jgi:hypothetical protein